MMDMESVSETLVNSNQLMQLVAQEDTIVDNTSWPLEVIKWSLMTGHVNVGHKSDVFRDICFCHQGMMTLGFHSKLI